MAKDRSADRHTTARHVVSVEDDLWHEFGEAVGERRRSEVVRDMIRAYLGKPGAHMPRRSGGTAKGKGL
jgi:metal-responsive CopG/Arc/MetJ family transcriptional regulator